MISGAQRAAAGLTAAGLALALAACGGSTSSTAAHPSGSAKPSGSAQAAGDAIGCPAAKGKVVGFSEPIADPNFAAIQQIVTKALAKYGVRLRALNANLNPGQQISDINTLLQQQVAVLIANPVDPNATQGVFNQARTAHIPIVALDTQIGGPYFTTVHDDMQYAGSQGALTLKSLVGSGEVGAIYGPAFAEILNWEKEAFNAAAQQAGLHVAVTAVNQAITPAVAQSIASAWKQRYGSSLKGIWTFNDTSAIGVASTFGASFHPYLVSINGQPDAVPLVSNGTINTTFGVPYDKTGQVLAYAALRAICGAKLPSTVYVPTVKLTKANIGSWEPISARVNNPFQVAFEQRDGKTYVKLG
jgi:ribose transport system substrate-binding protein